MNINELTTKLVSELRQIAKSIGIREVDKLRKQELINQIVASGTASKEEPSSPVVENERPQEQEHSASSEAEKPKRNRTRTTVSASSRQGEPDPTESRTLLQTGISPL